MRVPVDNDLRLLYFDRLLAAVPVPATTAETLAMLVALLDVAVAIGFAHHDAAARLALNKRVADGWVQSTLDELGHLVDDLKRKPVPPLRSV